MKNITEKDLNVLDLWQSPNGNLFLKINDSYSIALGTYESFDSTNTAAPIVKRNEITPARRVGKLVIKKEKLTRD